MKSLLRKSSLLLLGVLLCCGSCGDADLFDTDKWSDEVKGEWKPNVTLSVVKGSFTLWDLINQEANGDSVIIREGDELAIQYLKKDIYEITLQDVFDMPAEDVWFAEAYTLGNECVPNIPLPTDVTVDLQLDGLLQKIPQGCALTSIEASADFVLPALGFPYRIENVKLNETVLKERIEVEATGTAVSLDDFEIDLGADKMVTLGVSITIPQGTVLDDLTLNLEFGLRELTFIKAVGTIQVADIVIKPGEFDMDVDFLNEIGGKFKFTKPELSIILRNTGIGVPLKVDASFVGSNADGRSVELKANANATPYPLMTQGNKLLEMVPDTLTLNAANSNIVDFLALPPQGNISYSGTVKVNPEMADGIRDHQNVIYNDLSVGIALDAYVYVPFSLSADSLSYRDTLTDIDIDEKWADKILHGAIQIMAENGLPLNLRIPSLILLDENNVPLDTIISGGADNYLKAAQNGAVASSKVSIAIDKEQARHLGKTKNIILEAVAATSDLNGSGVDIKADAQLSFKMKVEAQAEIKDIGDL